MLSTDGYIRESVEDTIVVASHHCYLNHS